MLKPRVEHPMDKDKIRRRAGVAEGALHGTTRILPESVHHDRVETPSFAP